MNRDETHQMILESNMLFQKQLSNFMGDVKAVNTTILDKLDAQDKRSQERHDISEERWKETEAFIKAMTPARDGLLTIQNLIKFFKWAPAVGIALYWVIKKIIP